jgi:uncharacterized membrane protein YwaF
MGTERLLLVAAAVALIVHLLDRSGRTPLWVAVLLLILAALVKAAS